jgi:hypothetical protein
MPETHTGRCLCGAVRYEVDGPLRDILVCHCGECRRSHGLAGAYTACPAERLAVEADGDALAWIASPESTTEAERGFCRRCGSSLFWRAPGRDTVSISAGTVDEPSGLAISGHIWWDARAPWELPDGRPVSGAGT